MTGRPSQIVNLALRAVAAVLMLSLTVAAWHDVSQAWDVWYYHLPFASRIAGIIDPISFTFGPRNQANYEGFPLLGEALQGLLWRITGRPESANFVALAAIPGLAWFLKRSFAVPPHLTVLALLAIPLVQIHATTCYVDLPANACVTMLILLAYRQVVASAAPTMHVLVGASALAVASANMKFQLVIVVIAASLVFIATCLRKDAHRPRRLLVITLVLPLVFATPIKNAIRHGNPVWPIELHLLGKSLPHNERAYSSSPDWLENVPRPIRFGASVLELGLRPVASHQRWSVDQWTPPSHPGYRMGGFFGAYVAVNLAALALAAFWRRTREAKVAAVFACGATLVASLMPQSHELRYYLFWMMLLVSLNLAVWSREREMITGLVATGALLVVTWSTSGTYLYASGDSFATLLASKVDGTALHRIAPNERVCIARSPWTFLYAPRFHPPQTYSVQEAEGPAECGGVRLLE